MRKNRKLVVKLSPSDREQIRSLLACGTGSVRVFKRAQALRLLAEQQFCAQVAGSVGLTAKAVREIGWRYCEGGLNRALYEKPRPGGPRRLTDRDKQRIVAQVCSPPPGGRARWTVRLIAEEAVKRKVVGAGGRETVRLLLQRHDLKPWREKNVVRGPGGQRVSTADGRGAGTLRAASRPEGATRLLR